jgi:hypothetical protein
MSVSEPLLPAEGVFYAGYYVTFKVVPMIFCSMLGASVFADQWGYQLLLIAFGILDFLMTRNYFGLNLVGLKWYFDRSEAPDPPYIVFFSRPFPFVASTFDSNIFWVGLLVTCVIYLILAFALTPSKGLKWLFFCLFHLFLNLVNLWGFMKCHKLSKQLAENVARGLLLDASVAFQPAIEAPPSEDSESDGVSDGNAPPGDVEAEKTDTDSTREIE